MIWAYEAFSLTGTKHTSQIEAESQEAAFDQLVGSGLIPAQIVRYEGLQRTFHLSAMTSWWSDRKRQNSKTQFYEALLLFEGRSVDEALSAQLDYLQDSELAHVVREMLSYHRREQVGLGACMASQRPYFDDAECKIVSAAEEHAASREIGLRVLIDGRERNRKFSGVTLKALGPSGVLLLMCLGVMAFMGPRIHEIYDPMFKDSPDVQMPLLSVIVANVGRFLGSPLGFALVVGATISARLGFRALMRNQEIANAFDRFRFTLPFRLGTLFEAIVLARFCYLYGHLRRTGADYGDVADWVGPTLGSPRYAAACAYVAKRHRQDQVRPFDAMIETGVFGRMFLQAAGPGFEAGAPENVLIPLASRYEQQIEMMSTPIAWTLSIVAGAITSAIITLIMLATYMPSWALESHATL